MSETVTATTFGMSLDPMKPLDLVLPDRLASAPPKCPACQNFLHSISKNAAGDLLFECLNDGYETVYRVGANLFVPRPGRDTAGWVPPDAPTARKLRQPMAVVPSKPVSRRQPVH